MSSEKVLLIDFLKGGSFGLPTLLNWIEIVGKK